MASLVSTAVTGTLTVSSTSTFSSWLKTTNYLYFDGATGRILLNTADAADTKVLYVGGGGDAGQGRGAYIGLYGNDHSSSPGTLEMLSGTSGEVKIYSGGSERLTIANGGAATFTGKVSAFLNTTSSPLHTRGSNIIFDAANGGTNVNILARAYDETYWGQLEFTASRGILYTRTTGPLQLGANNAAAICIVNGGKVGIGTTAPAKPLHVNVETGWATLRLEGASDSGGEIEFYKSSTKTGSLFFDAGSSFNLRAGSSGTNHLVITSAGVATFSGTLAASSLRAGLIASGLITGDYSDYSVANEAAATGTKWGWTGYAGNTIAVTSEQIVITQVDSTLGAFRYFRSASPYHLTSDLIVDEYYTVSIKLKYAGASAPSVRIYDGANYLSGFATLTTSFATYTTTFQAKHAANAFIAFYSFNAANDTITVDNITINGAATFGTLEARGAATFSGSANGVGVTLSDGWLELYNANVLQLYSTPTTAGANYETFALDKLDAGNARLRVYKSGTGTYRGMEFQTGGSARLTISAAGAATFSGHLTTDQVIIKQDYSVLYFQKTDATLLGYLLMRDGATNYLATASGQDFGIVEGNTRRMTFQTSTGHVGIGTTNPQQLVHVRGSVPSIMFTHTTNGDLGFLGDATDFLPTGATADSFGVRSEGDLRLGTNGNNCVMVIDTSGTQDHKGNYTVNSQTVEALQDGTCYDFDGTSGNFLLTSDGSDAFANQTFTVSGWVNMPDATPSDDRAIFSYDHTSHVTPHYATHIRVLGATGKLFFAWNDGSSYQSLQTAAQVFTDNTWHHFACTFKSGKQVIYIDGVEIASSTRTDTITFYAQEVWIGRAGYGTTDARWDGKMRSIQYFPYALEDTDVRKLYSGENPKKNLNVELVTNGSFASDTGWTKETGWTISGGKAVATGVLINQSIYQSITLTTGKTYKAVLEISDYSAGGIFIHDLVGNPSPTYASNGTHTFIFTAEAGQDYINLRATATTTLKVDNVSFVEVGTLVDFNPRSASTTKWYNAAIPSLYNGDLQGGVTLSAGSTDHYVGGDLAVTGNVKLPILPSTTANAAVPILFRPIEGTISGDSSFTWNPAEDSLYVNGTVITANYIRSTGSNPMKLGSAAGGVIMELTSTGKVGIGTNSASSILTVNSEISCGTNDDNRSMFGYELANSRFYIGTRQAGTNYFDTVTVKSGNVGIGITNPGHLLAVNGTANIVGALTGTTATFTQVDVDDFRIRDNIFSADTADGSDTKELYICAGGAQNANRGAYIDMTGNDYPTWGGLISMVCGEGANAGFNVITGGVNRLAITNAGAATFSGDIRNSGGTGYHVSIVNADIRQTCSTTSQGDWAWNVNTDNTFYVYDYNASAKRLNIKGATGQIQFNSYGGGTHTGTSAYKLSVDSSGNIIETSIGSGAVDGAGTTNYLPKWTDGDTIGNSIVYNHAYGVVINATSLGSYATNRQVFEVRGTAGTGAFDGGITNLSGSSDTNAHRVGQLVFINTANANHVNPNAAAGSRIAQILSTVVTSDSNAGDDSGGDLQFWTKAEAGAPAERMRIISDGKVGIGTTSPGAPLVVVGTGDNARIGSASDGVVIAHASGVGYLQGTDTGGSAYNALGFKTSANYALYIDTSDRVGIGTDSPLSQFHQSDATDANFHISCIVADEARLVSINDANNAYKAMKFYGGRFEFLAGNVGIGTAAPTKKLDVRSEARVWNGTNGIELSYSTGNTSGIVASANTSGNLEFRPNVGASAAMFILNNRNVGIGTTNPSTLLEVNGALTINGNISNTADGGYFYLNNAGTGNNGVYIAGFSGDTMRYHVPVNKYFEWEVGGAQKLKLTSAGLLTVTGTGVTATLFSGSGASLTTLNATQLTSGTVPVARLGDGNESSSTFLRGDNTWQTVGGGSGTVTSVTTPASSGLDISESTPAPSITLDLAELTDMTGDIGSTDEVILLDTGSGGGQRRKAFGELKLSQFNNDSGWTDSTVTSVTTPADSGVTIANTTTTPSITLDFFEFTDFTADIIGAYEIVFLETGSGGGQRRKAFSELKLSKFNNDSGWTSNAGTVTSITAGDGLSGGAITSSGTIANTDKGSSQNIFKSMQAKNSAGTTIGTCVADTNSDTFILKELGNGVNLTVAAASDTMTIGLDNVLGLFTRLDMDETDTRQKIRLYGTSDNFCLGFNSGYTFGGLGGDGTGNPAFVLTAQNSDTAGRGFWWGDAGHSDAQGAMAVSVDGRLTVATAVRVGFGESDTVEPGSSSSSSELNVNGTIEATAYLGLDWEDLPNISTLGALPA